MSNAVHSTESHSLEDKELAGLPTPRKVVLLVFLCLAQFLDTFANSSLFAAIPPISVQLGISNSDSVWLIRAAAIAAFSLAAGFVRTQVPLIILRALMGVGAALTVPSALYLIIHLFPIPAQQAKAVSLFAASAALGNVSGFFVWEARLAEDMAAIPPSLWQVRNFAVLAASATLPFMWWGAVQLLFSWIWQNVYGWTPIIAALHFLPLGLLGFPMNLLSSLLQQKFPLKWVIFFGQFVAIAGSLLLPFGDSPQHYWRFVFPGFCLGTSGITIAFTTVNIAIFAATPPEKAGVVGSIFNCFLQLGCAAGTAIITSIQTSVDASHGGPTVWTGRAAGLWFLFGLLAIETLCIMVFMHNTMPPTGHTSQEKEKRADMPDVAD
ncbi:hypothetical protein C0992_005492 [Termitomyces sp. T32_za158]|nr:hypothetical protein C0992_005492 [Termitomyces sp. T32_za158]